MASRPNNDRAAVPTDGAAQDQRHQANGGSKSVHDPSQGKVEDDPGNAGNGDPAASGHLGIKVGEHNKNTDKQAMDAQQPSSTPVQNQGTPGQTQQQQDAQYGSTGHGQQQMYMGNSSNGGAFGKSSSGKIHFQIINNYNVNINNNYPETNNGQGAHQQPQMSMHNQNSQPGVSSGGSGQQAAPTAIRVNWNPAGPGQINHQLQNQQPLPFVIEGLENVTDPHVQEKILAQVHGSFNPNDQSSSIEQSPSTNVVRGEGGQQHVRMSMANVTSHAQKVGDRAVVPDRIQTQQSQQSFLPYEENGIKRHDIKFHGNGHPSSGKSNNSSIKSAQKGSNGGAEGGLNTQSSVGNGLQYSQNYQQQVPQHSGQATAPFRRKASNTNKQSLTQLKNQSLQHEDESGAHQDAGPQEAINRQKIAGTSQHIAGIGINYNKGGGTFVAPKGLASVNRGGNKYINSKNANIGKGQLGGGPLHQNSQQSNSLGRDSLKSAGGMVNFDASIGSGVSGSQGPVPHGTMAGLVSQQHNVKGHKIGTSQYGRQNGPNGMNNAPGNAYAMNEFRESSKQKHSDEMKGQHGSSNPRKYDSFDEENPYLPYQNQMKTQGGGTNSSNMNTRITQLNSSLNSGLNGLATGGSFVGGGQVLNPNIRGAREGSGPSHNIKNVKVGKSVGPPIGADLNGSQNSNMKLLQDHAPGAIPKLLNKNSNSNNGDYNNNSNKGSLNSFKGAGYNRKMSPDKSIPMIKQMHQQYNMNQPGSMMASAGQYYIADASGNQNISQPRINVMKNQPKNKFDHNQHLNQSHNFQNSGNKDNGRIVNRSLNKAGIQNSIHERIQERQKQENGSQISSTSFNKPLQFVVPTSANVSKKQGTDSVKLNNLNRGGTQHNRQRNDLAQNNFEKCNPVCNDEEDMDDDVYEAEEFETVEPIAQNYGGHDGGRGQSGAPGAGNVQNMGNNTFYAGQQNAKFFDKRMLASQKQNRPKNTLGPGIQAADIDQNSQGQSGYSPHIKQQRVGKKNQNAQVQRATGQGGAVRPSVNESMLPSLSRTGNNFNPLVAGSNPRKGEGVGQGQRVQSRRTSTRQKADVQGARIIHSRQRNEQFMNDHPNVYTLNMNNEKISPDQSHSKIPFSNYNHSQPRNQTQGSQVHPGSMTQKKNNFKIKQLPVDLQGREMENEAREHLNLAQYNFNRMAVISEEGEPGYQGGSNRGGGAARRSTRGVNDQLMSAGQDRKGSKNMHNTTTNFYHHGFGDRLPTRGDVQSRGRQNLIPSAQGTRRGNSRAENSFGRVQQMQINQANSNKGGTHYGGMFQENTQKSLIGKPGPGLGLSQQNSNSRHQEAAGQGGRNASIGIAMNSKSIPQHAQNKSRVRISTDSMQNMNNQVSNNSGQPYQVNNQRVQSQQPGSQKMISKHGGVARRNSQMNERDAGSIGRISGAFNSGNREYGRGQQSGMNIGNYEEFDQFSNGHTGNQYDHGFDPPHKMDSGRGVSSGFNKNSAVDGFMAHNHMFDIEEDEDNEDQQNDANQ